jgi:hypothetical protein
VGRKLYIEPLGLEMQQEFRFKAHVAFNNPGAFDGEPALKTLQDTANLVDDIVTTLGRFLP